MKSQIGWKTVRIRQDTHDRLVALAQHRGITTSTMIKLLAENPVVQADGSQETPAITVKATPSLKPSTHTLDQCADTLLGLLPRERYDLAREVCEQILGIRKWQLVVGHLMKVADQGALQAPLLDPRWDRTADVAPQSAMCEWCRDVFTPSRVGQRFCMEKTPPCGAQWARSKAQGPQPRDPGIEGLLQPNETIALV